MERTVDKSEGRNRGRSMPGLEEMMLVAYLSDIRKTGGDSRIQYADIRKGREVWWRVVGF